MLSLNKTLKSNDNITLNNIFRNSLQKESDNNFINNTDITQYFDVKTVVF